MAMIYATWAARGRRFALLKTAHGPVHGPTHG